MLGPVPADGKTPFFLATVSGGNFYVLNSWQNPTTSQALVYYFDPTYLDSQSGEPAAYSPPYFTATSSGGEIFTLKDVTVQPQGGIETRFRSNRSGGGLSLQASVEPPTVSHGNPVALIFSPNGAAPWQSQLLTGVSYSISDPSSGEVVSFYSGAVPPLPPYGSPSPPFLGNNVFVLPLDWYFSALGKCVAGGNVLQSAYCSTPPFSTSAGCQSGGRGWTEIGQCQEGVVYEYCPPGQQCGQNNCNGPCPRKEVCQLGESEDFSCRQSPQEEKEKVILTAGSVVLVSGFVIILIVGGLFLYAIIKKSSK